jgi:hypothetical protein
MINSSWVSSEYSSGQFKQSLKFHSIKCFMGKFASKSLQKTGAESCERCYRGSLTSNVPEPRTMSILTYHQFKHRICSFVDV